MSPELASEEDLFEFRALEQAKNYRRALVREFRPWLRGNVLEVGAGIGQLTVELAQVNGIDRLVALEPNPSFAKQLPTTIPRIEPEVGTAFSLHAQGPWNAIVSVNVLEHIERDEAELRRYAELLAPARGALCLFVPARPELYAPIDRAFGHHRRYTLPGLRAKLEGAGLRVQKMHYLNLLGYFAWWLTFKARGKMRMEPREVSLFDRWMFPLSNALERRVGPPPFGQSLMAVATA